jgi:hypothetical protein
LQEWSKFEHYKRRSCPAERTGHSALCLGYGGGHPQLLVIGGRSNSKRILNDAWILDLETVAWTEVRKECVVTGLRVVLRVQV